VTIHDRGSRVIQVVETTTLEGNGKDESYREVVTYRTMDGELLAVYDPLGHITKVDNDPR
jgi:hypothetical protein